ncbi:MAG: gamma-glutamylcyclotransferase [Alphaproteobacteria bacterium]|nr:MAG: gamma-glutamylcyclotransferase [Alphaproteobacteria bacterium]
MSGEFWVFAYGSLMWRPGFEFAERQIAELPGLARRFCLRSIHYRGTEADPGLVLALAPDPAARCRGVAYRVGAAQAEETLAYLRERELVSYAYREERHPIRLDDGRQVTALAYVLDPEHEQTVTGLSLDAQAEIIARAEGRSGTNRDYLYSTREHLLDLGIEEPEIEALVPLVRRLAGDEV